MDTGLPPGLGGGDNPGALSAPIYSVTQLNREVRALLEEAYPLVWVEGELSNVTHHRSGHMYFTLKDESGQVDAAMFRGANQRLQFRPEAGMAVLALAQVTVYEPRGRYQVVVQEMRPAGAGKLQLAFEQLKAKLEAEGLFAPERKRALPAFPERVGIVTASGAAALRDVASVLARRYPLVELCLFPAKVQGEGAGKEVAAAIEAANRFSQETPLDVLIVGRGGGSLEDLWAFNEEVTARAIFASDVPVVSAVGHEVDFTIADFVADARAATPSAAAELVVPNRVDLLNTLRSQTAQLVRLSRGRWESARQRLDWTRRSHGLRRPLQRLRDGAQRLDGFQGELIDALARRVGALGQRHALLGSRLDGLNPATLLRRGFAVVRSEGGELIKQAEQVQRGDALAVRLGAGRLRARVEEVWDE